MPGRRTTAASKAGLIGLTKIAGAGDGQPRNHGQRRRARIRADGYDGRAVATKLKEKLLANIPLRRMGEPADVAAAVRFLASDEAGYITGHVLDVNGGMYM